ncbi:MAG: acyloxyacyl hydrolase [Phycisphaerales bacterium]|nr:acyloxyacyl hydrolase [Phycisphaerales bacterium]
MSTSLATAAAATFCLQPTLSDGLMLDLAHIHDSTPVATDQVDPAWTALSDLALRSCFQGEGDLANGETQSPPAFGTEGSRRLTIKGQYGLEFRDQRDQEASLGAGLVYFMVDDFAFAPELNAWGFWQDGDDAWGVSLDVLFQWHFHTAQTWSVFTDFGCGMLATTSAVPSGGSSFNFTPQAGLGVTFDVGEQDTRAVVGVKWHHISNASLYRDNPGRDSVVVYAALSMPW